MAGNTRKNGKKNGNGTRRRANGNGNGKKKNGRPKREFTPAQRAKITAETLKGTPLHDICRKLKTGFVQIYRLEQEDEKFRLAQKEARAVRLMRVEDTAYRMANGLIPVNEDFHPPCKTMNIFLLKNWAPDRYKDRREVAVSGVTLPEALDLCDEK